MGLLTNLKKRFNNWVDRTLAELCSAYIKQLAKQTSRKRDNCSSMEYLPNRLTTARPRTTIVTSSLDTSEKITSPPPLKDEDLVRDITKWVNTKITNPKSKVGDAHALYKEFEEWIEVEDETDLEIFTIE